MDPSVPPTPVPPSVAQVLARFQSMEREEKMQALLAYAKRLEPVPERLASLDRTAYTVHECRTRVDLFTELHDGRLHFWADVNARESPTVAAFLAITLAAVNDQPPETALSIPPDFVSTMMSGLGLSARETGLNALVARLKREAGAALDSGASERQIGSDPLAPSP